MCKAFTEPQEKSQSPSPVSPLSPATSGSLGGLLERVKGQARTLRRSRKNRFRKYSHSISNLSELLEAEEDEMNRQNRLQKLQFPLESEVSRDYFELEGQKDEVERRLNDLIHHGLTVSKHTPLKRSSSDPELSSALGDEIILEELDEGVTNTPLESFHELLKRFQKEIPPPRPFPREAPPMYSSLTAAFDTLQHDLDQPTDTPPVKSKLQSDVVKISPVMPKKQTQDSNTDASPRLKSKDETFALMDSFISQITSAAGELDSPFSFTQSQPSPSAVESTYNNNVCHTDGKRKTAVSSPQLMVRKKSLPVVMMMRPPDIIESTETSRYHNLLQDLHRGHRRNNSESSTFSLGSSSSLSSAPYQSQHGSMSSIPLDLDAKEPLVQSLNTLVLLSLNHECITNLISRICIPDFKDKMVVCARSEESSTALVTNIARLVHNLFEVSMLCNILCPTHVHLLCVHVCYM